MQDTSRPVNPLLKEAPPQGASVVDSSTHQPEKASLTPYGGTAASLARRRGPSDMAGLLLVITAVVVCFSLLTRTKLEHCVNDGSRWNTVFYLVEYGTYEFKQDWGEINGVNKRGAESPEQYIQKYNAKSSPADQERIKGLLRQFGDRFHRHVWDIPPFSTVDMICVPDAEGNPRFYSSKPPLLSTCAAGVVIGIEKIASWFAGHPYTFRDHPMFYMRLTVILLQVIPFLIMVWVIRLHVVEQTDSTFVQNFCIAAAALATYLTSYAAPLNNHLVAACCVMFAIHAVVRIWRDGRREWYWFLMAGLFGGLCHALELPATLLTVVVWAAVFHKARRRALLISLPAMLIPIAASLYTTYLVTGSVQPIPMRFNEAGGPFHYEGSYWHANKYWPHNGYGIDSLQEPKQWYLFNLVVGHHGFFSLTPLFVIGLIGMGRHLAGSRKRRAVLCTLVLAGAVSGVGFLWHSDLGGSSLSWSGVASAASQPSDGPQDSPAGLTALSHVAWGSLKVGLACIKLALTNPGATLDQGADRLWGIGFFTLVGMLFVVNLGMYLGEPEQRQPWLAAETLVLFLVILLFYTFSTNNYAGVSQGPRWLFWTIPFWLLMLPAGIGALADLRLGRWLCYLCLFVSLVTVAWGFPRPQEDVRATDRPYTTSWLHEYFISRGWSQY